jgi:hypothetical protein
MIWPLFLKNRGGFFAVSAEMGENGRFTWQLEQVTNARKEEEHSK